LGGRYQLYQIKRFNIPNECLFFELYSSANYIMKSSNVFDILNDYVLQKYWIFKRPFLGSHTSNVGEFFSLHTWLPLDNPHT